MGKVSRVESAWIPMRDGCRLAARLWIPDGAERVPVPAILEYLPYRLHDFTRLRDEGIHGYYAAHGYAGVRVDIRGTGNSGGLLEDEYTQQELDDGVEAIHWLAAQPWCSGAVGMTGFSWGGFNALQVAALRPAPLKAIVTACSTDDRYADDIHAMGGCLITDKLKWASNMSGFNSLPPDPAVAGADWRSQWLERLDRQKPWFIEWLSHQRRDAYMRHGSIAENYADVECAVYAVGGWADAYTNAVFRLLSGLSCPRKGLVGPWAHGWPHGTGPGPLIGYLQETLRWWDYWLKGIETGIMQEPMLRVWMQSSVPPAHRYETRPGRWVAENAWPSDSVSPRSWVLNRGSLDDAPSGTAVLTARTPQLLGLHGGEWCPYGMDAEMALDQRAEDGQSIAFESGPLPADVEILGFPVVELELAVDRPVAFVVARLNDVWPDGSSTLVSYGMRNLTHDDRHETVTPVEPGRRQTLRLDLNAVAHAFPRGHRIRLALSTTYWPLVWPSPESVELSVFTGVSRLVLPARPPLESDGALAAFGPPEQAVPGPHAVLEPPGRRRIVRQDVREGESIVEAFKSRGRTWLGDLDLTICGSGSEMLRLRENEPLSARHESHYTMTLERAGLRIRTEADTVLTATNSDFLVAATLEAFEGEALVFARTWNRRIARDGV